MLVLFTFVCALASLPLALVPLLNVNFVTPFVLVSILLLVVLGVDKLRLRLLLLFDEETQPFI